MPLEKFFLSIKTRGLAIDNTQEDGDLAVNDAQAGGVKFTPKLIHEKFLEPHQI